MYDLIDKVAVITGGANGMGKSYVREFLKENAKYVAFIDIDDISGKELENEIELKYGKGRAHFFKCDVSKAKDMNDVFDEIMKKNGNIDIVVNNAAIALESPDMFVKEIEVNFVAVVSSSLKALELMRVDNGGKGGTIINISSIAALSRNIGYLHVYAATKSAVLCFSNRFGDTHYSETKVRIMTACLGVTDTRLIQKWSGYDEISNKNMNSFANKTNVLQTAEEAAERLVEIYKKGESGNTWIINNNKVIEITDKIKQADEIMSSVLV